VLPLSGSSNEEETQRISQSVGKRLILIATNVAESGVTLPDIKHCIDGLTHKRASVLPSGIHVIEEQPISQASSLQRRGRAGRMGPGKYYPMCTEICFLSLPRFISNEFESMPKYIPVISLIAAGLPANEILLIKDPEYQQILQELVQMDLIRKNESGYQVTQLGLEVSRYPLTIKSSVCLLKAMELFDVTPDKFTNRRNNFFDLLCAIIAVCMIDCKASCSNMFDVPREERKNRKDYITSGVYGDYEGSNDICVLIRIFADMMSNCLNNKGYVDYRKWCREKKIGIKFIEMAHRLFNQVSSIVFDGNRLTADDFTTVFNNSESLYRMMQPILANVYADRVFTLVRQYPKPMYSSVSGGTYAIDSTSLATMWMSVPVSVIALSETVIKIPGRPSLFLIGTCFPISGGGDDDDD
jgi:HrpA-like RNA helicase